MDATFAHPRGWDQLYPNSETGSPARAILGDGTDARSASAERSESPTGATKAFAFTRFGIATAPTTNQIDLISSCRFIAEHFQITQ
jgi:hypothetical protein